MDEYEAWKSEQARTWLNHLRERQFRVKRLQDEIDVQRSLALPKGIDYSKMQFGGLKHDALENAAIKLVELIADYVAELDEYLREQRDAHERITRIGEPYSSILTRYYLLGNEWKDVADKENYSLTYCADLRTEALPMVYDVMPAQWRVRIPRADG